MYSVFGILLILNLILATNTANPYDPGLCRLRHRGRFTVVEDRKGDDKVLVCVKEGGKYHWKMIDGHSYGNYFDPAKSCSDIVDNVPEAENGIYWIKTSKGVNKVWCDVVTDGGGFMLIGVKDTPVTWSVPSDPTVVEPLGKTHWSSAFGDKDVLDFRVQILTSKSFDDTKSHWYYRFRSTRKLNKLLMYGKGGCSSNFPGMGDIAYVKDLASKQIVTEHFQCSRFGAHFVKGLGWDKMNTCFSQKCNKGYAHIAGFRYDSSGSFSYSVVSPRSGIQHNSTAFLGCDHGKCCACYGPSTDKDYCAPKCKAINGGTILTKNNNVHAWFWIRSSLPKRVWKKCMEYKKKTKTGQTETWHVAEEGGTARKGTCSHPGEVRLTDGVAVVSDNRSISRLPNIEGLLSYRSDNERLYLRGKTQWKGIGSLNELQNMRNMVGNIYSQVKQLGRDIEKLKTYSASCQRALKMNSNAKNGAYKMGRLAGFPYIYCQMTPVQGCSGGGWTLVMKIDGKKDTFAYSSSFWSNKQSYNPAGGMTGFDDQETKLPTYWSTSFKELCIGMKVGNHLRFVSISYQGSSLHSVIADGKYRATNLGRQKWKSLIKDSSLQYRCNKEGFNVQGGHSYIFKARLGVLGNEDSNGNCITVDSYIGLGGPGKVRRYSPCGRPYVPNSCGNSAFCGPDKGERQTRAMGYILIR